MVFLVCSEKIIRLIESYLYSYFWIYKKVLEIKGKYLIDDKDINSWIKSKVNIFYRIICSKRKFNK